MNPPVRDATPIEVPPVAQVTTARADPHDFWDAPWTLDDEWHPEPAPFGADPATPDFLMIL